MKVKFLKTCHYKSCRRNEAGAPIHPPKQLSYVTTSYEAEKVYELSDEMAKRFIDRGSAVEVPAPAAAGKPRG